MYYPKPDDMNVSMNIHSQRVVTISQLQHLASLVAEGKCPNGNYGDVECLAWEVLNNLHENPEFFK